MRGKSIDFVGIYDPNRTRCEVFRREVGLTPVRYRHTLLVQEAMGLLLRTNLTVEEISDRLGFSSSCYFRRVFSSIAGKTPREIRG